ncbi:MAG TPA: DUF2911 domain-containing protein [Chryseolinea sp.]|nr:DUF2911 domain-containing protein [Chryseolinea sp.]
MKKLSTMLTAITMIAAMLVSVSTWAQSPAATASGKLASGANITIKYGAPSVKGRKIYGTELVPYGKVWRAGANEATILETDKDITIEGKAVPKGKYSVYAIASEKDWQIIINSQTGQWGITRAGETTRDVAKDVAVVTVTPKKAAAMTEQLKYVVSATGFSIIWENLEIPVSVK